MASPRKTWRNPDWSTGSFVPQRPDLRAEYGEAIAELVELYALMARDHRDEPRAQDIKHTLRALWLDPASADVRNLDTSTAAWLDLMQWRLYRRQGSLRALSLAELAQCAQAALNAFKKPGGRPNTDALAAALVRGLCELTQDLPKDRRRPLLCAALEACGIGRPHDEADREAELEKTVQRIIRKSGTPSEHWRLP